MLIPLALIISNCFRINIGLTTERPMTLANVLLLDWKNVGMGSG